MNRAKFTPGKIMVLSPARELADQIHRNTVRGFAFSMSFFAMIIATYFAIISIGGAEPIQPPLITDPGTTIVSFYDEFPKPLAEIPQLKPEMVIGSGKIAGDPIPIPATELRSDNLFASVEDIHRSLSVAGDVIGDIFKNSPEILDGKKDQVRIATREIEVDPDEDFIFQVDKEPAVDLSELQRQVIYPPLAIKAGIEGKVVVTVLIGRNGRAEKVKILSSTSSILEPAAIDAVRKAIFTPAIMGNSPVKCWLSIPISFNLK